MTCDSTSKQCVIKPTAKLDVTLVSAEIDSSKSWDSGLEGNAAPDAYIELAIGSQIKKSRTVDNAYSPVFNEYLMTATASDLMGSIKLKVMDFDMWSGDDTIADCVLPCDTANPTMCGFYDWELENGSAIIYFPCSGSADLKSISFKFSPAP
jgi:hypothetical protein